MIEDLLDLLSTYSAQDVQDSPIKDLQQLCRQPVFKLLCDVCDALRKGGFK